MDHKVVSIPKPSYLDKCEYLHVRNGRKVWRSTDGKRLYTWDEYHGEIEVFSAKTKIHLAVADPLSGKTIKPAVKGRKLYD
ncbi:colicin E3/pyocin S6 family cytotoxin [Paenibacillus polysaccharolyticus]|uniref:colicin E3/pyocin S6 family cytotoxin n=1 Tax=Paenibacillus polysaccharolyticus TaxID=582692 RepID=UPI003008F5D3